VFGGGGSHPSVAFFTSPSSFATIQYTSTSTSYYYTKLYADIDDNNCCTIGTSKLKTKSGKQVCRYALGGAARSTQPKSLPLKYRDMLIDLGEDIAPFYFYYNPHRYQKFMSGVRESFTDDETYQNYRDNLFFASGGTDRSIDELDQRLEDALVHCGGDYLDAFVLEYVCPYELTSDKQQIDTELRLAIEHVHKMKNDGKIRYVMSSTRSHEVGSVLASTKLEDGITPAFDSLMLRYSMSHRNAAESISLPKALDNNIPVLAFTTTRWNRLQSNPPTDNTNSYPTTSDCIKFALQHPAIDIVIHSARDDDELDESILPLISTASKQSTWLSEDEYDLWRAYGNDEVKWNEDDSFDEYPEESIV